MSINKPCNRFSGSFENHLYFIENFINFCMLSSWLVLCFKIRGCLMPPEAVRVKKKNVGHMQTSGVTCSEIPQS